MTGGQVLVRSLLAQGVTDVFGLPGVQLDWAFDALYEARDRIKVYHTRHEQAASYMADGYARTTGRTGVCLVVPGPGLLNAMAGLATAYACSSPVLCITGQIPSRMIDAGIGMLHEIKDQLGAARSVSKWTGRAVRPDEIPGVVREAFRQLGSGRPHPVVIEIPPDTLQAEAEAQPIGRVEPDRPSGDPEALARAAKALGQAERPIIYTGGGAFSTGAFEPLARLAELLEAPVVMSTNGRGALSDRHHLAQSILASPDLLPAADVVLVAGTRFLQPAHAEWGPREDQMVIHVDIDPQAVGRHCPADIGIVADARLALDRLVAEVPRHNRKRPSRREELTRVKQIVAGRLSELQPQATYAQAIRDALPDDGVIVNESTQVGYFSSYGFPVYRPRGFLQSGYQGTLGYGFGTALGAQVGAGSRKVVSINGDGGFMYNVQELSTMVLHRINAVAVVFNDNAYGNVRRIQQESFGGRLIASDLHNPDFVRLAEAFGLDGLRADNPDALRKALERALGADRPALIDAPVGEMPSIWAALRTVMPVRGSTGAARPGGRRPAAAGRERA